MSGLSYPPIPCRGAMPRRAFVRAGLVGVGSLGLSDLLRLQAAADSVRSNKSLLVLWLWGGPSHMETFDLKPDAPVEYRGEFRPIPTNVPGVEISEHLPKLAALADKFAILRSLHHDSPGHVNSTHTLMTGYPGELVETPPYHPKYPDVTSVVQKMLGARNPRVPAHVALPSVRYGGSAYLGSDLRPFSIPGDPSSPKFKPPGVAALTVDRPAFSERMDLLQRFDGFRRQADSSGVAASLDRFQGQALSILTSNRMRRALDLSLEHPRLRDRYGRHEVGQRCLLARRMIEAGARIVTVDFPNVRGQKAFSWDDHASVWNIFEQMKIRLPVLDQVVSALITDLHERGLSDDVLLLVMGEMSHTPRLSNYGGQPGREHWGRTMSAFLAGGGLAMGQAVGATGRKGDEIVERPISAADFVATLYRYFGIPLNTHFDDHFGRPVPIHPGGRPVEELFRRA